VKKILITVMTLALVAVLGVGGAFAVFSDTETSEDNTFTAGTLDLKVDDADDPGVTTKITIDNMKPGDTGSVDIEVKNDGTIDGVADLHIKNLVNAENVVTEPEVGASGEDGTEPGELGAYLLVTITYAGGPAADPVVNVPLNDLDCQNKILGDLLAGETKTITISWELPSATGNCVQSDSCTFDIEFSLDQK